MEDIVKSETKLFKYISGTRLMERWGLDLVEIRQILLQQYEEKHYYDWVFPDDNEQVKPQIGLAGTNIVEAFSIPVNEDDFKKICYKLADIEKFEHEHPEIINTPLTKKEACELGRLRKEQNKVDMYLQAAVDIGLWCNDVQEPVTRKMLVDKIQDKYPEITKKAINKHFWQAVPKDLRHPGDHIKQS